MCPLVGTLDHLDMQVLHSRPKQLKQEQLQHTHVIMVMNFLDLREELVPKTELGFLKEFLSVVSLLVRYL